MDLKKLKKLRVARGKKIIEVSAAIGVSRETLSKIERGMVNPSFNTVVSIVKFLDSELIISF